VDIFTGLRADLVEGRHRDFHQQFVFDQFQQVEAAAQGQQVLFGRIVFLGRRGFIGDEAERAL
jgi:hypothetical protein